MRTATIQEAKEQLEELIAAAQSGEEVQIFDEGKQVVALTASGGSETKHKVTEQTLSPREALIARMVAKGLMKRNPLPPDPGAVEELPESDEDVVATLLHERQEGW